MDPQILLVLVLIVVALVLFAIDRFPVDVIALGLVVVLTLTGLLTPQEAFAGFGSDTVMMILGLLIMTGALVRTGVVEYTGKLLFRFTGNSSGRIRALLLLIGGGLSSFMSNTAATAFFLPMVIGLAHQARISVAKLLMPLAFSTILASSVTLVATSTNLVVSGMMTQYGLPPLGLFELTPVGIPILIVGLLYMYFIGDRLIPDRTPVDGYKEAVGKRIYLTEIIITDDSTFVGKTLAETSFGRDLEIQVLRVVRDKRRYLIPRADLRLEAKDELLVECARTEIMRVKQLPGVEIKADLKFADALQNEGINIFEVILLPGSSFIGRTLRALRVRERYDIQVLAINRHGEPERRKLSQVRMGLGDVLLVQGDRATVEVMEEEGIFTILDDSFADAFPATHRAPRAVLIFLGALTLAALEIVPLSIATIGGAVVAFITRCITPEEAYRQVEWKVLILIGSMLALGVAMEQSGTSVFLAQQIVGAFGHFPPLVLLSAFFFLTVILTQPLSNQAAAIVVLPVALQTALQLNFDPRTFAIMIAVAASCGFLTPLEPACVMIYGPGRYKFMDFVKVGALLTLLIYLIAIILVPLFWNPVL